MGTGLPLYSGSNLLALYTQQSAGGALAAGSRRENDARGQTPAAPRIRRTFGAEVASADHLVEISIRCCCMRKVRRRCRTCLLYTSPSPRDRSLS
eukprot:8939944-Pyramimonas_sp.AAC.1